MTFEEATTVFADPLARIVEDVVHGERTLIIGESMLRRVLVAVFVDDDPDEIRVISARCANKRERKRYEEDEEA